MVDDEVATVPIRLGAGTLGKTRRPGPRDPAFKEQAVGGSFVVASAYVTLRWQAQPIVARMVVAYVPIEGGGLVCNPQRHTGLFIYDQATQLACSVSFLERPYWAQRSSSMTPLRLALTTTRVKRSETRGTNLCVA